MAQFRKKPVVIEAVQFCGDMSWEEMPSWLDEAFQTDKDDVGAIWFLPHARLLVIHTLEGMMVADAGDWVIRGVKGEVYSCKPDIFVATYEGV